MAYWGKMLGGAAGFVMGGPFGAVMGAALGHAADQSSFGGLSREGMLGASPLSGRLTSLLGPARLAAMLGRRDQLFAIVVVVLSAKLAKCDGRVNRQEIDAFKRHFRIPPDSVRDIGRLFDQARASADPFGPYARQLGEAFADSPSVLEDVLAALFGIARADGALTVGEAEFLRQVHHSFRLDRMAWERASGSAPSRAADAGGDPYAELGVSRVASDEDLRATWKRLMRENHPDSLASRGVPQEFIDRAGDKVARINAAWDRIKRERGL